MFKQKQKLDPKIRFQNRSFKQQLQSARNYKRTTRKLPDKEWQIYLSKAGLGPWWAKTLVVLAIFAIIYVIFIPNLFYVRQINVVGFKTDDQQTIKDSMYVFLNSSKSWPQKNLLLLSKARLSDYLLANNQDIYKVVAIKKQWPNTLNLELQPRIGKFAVDIQDKRFIVSNDGKVLEEAATSTPADNLVDIKFKNSDPPQTGDNLLNNDLISTINNLNQQLPNILSDKIAYYEMGDPGSFDLSAYTTIGFKVNFDVKSNIDEALTQLRLLYSGVSDTDKYKLCYIDMRFEDKSYVCFKNAPCVRDIIIQNTATTTLNTAATTTPTSTPVK